VQHLRCLQGEDHGPVEGFKDFFLFLIFKGRLFSNVTLIALLVKIMHRTLGLDFSVFGR
jgi:hypothetical protein